MTKSLPNVRLQGRWLVFVRLLEVITVCLLLAVFAVAASERFTQLSTISATADTLVGQLRPEDAQAIVLSGLPVHIYAAYFTIFEFLVAITSTLLALMIAWIRPKDRAALLVSLMFVSIGMMVAALGMTAPEWQNLVIATRVVFYGSLIPFIYLFPDGRFVPRWTRWLSAAWMVYMLAWIIFPALRPPYAFGGGLTAADFPRIAWLFIWIVSGVVAQVYRYQRFSNAVQRQQTKWAVLGFVILPLLVFTGIFLLGLSPYIQPGLLLVLARLAGPSMILLGSIVILLSIGISVLRYRLWDIDVIIRLTLVYSLLTAFLALAYFGSVLLGQQLFGLLTGQFGQSPFFIVLVTLAIATLFNPLRRRIQKGIDQRFYRQKYDAEKVLADFGTTLREEVDLERLRQSIHEVVVETMQPAYVSVWIKGPADKGRRQEGI